MIYVTPITDRTATDIANRTAKAFFNIADWQRVYNNSEVTKLLVEGILRIDTNFETLTTPVITTIPTVGELNALLANIERVRVKSGLPAITGLVEIKDDWAEGSGADAPDYLNVNDWENVLNVIWNSIVLDAEYFIYCGVAASGQPRFYQHRWRQFQWVPVSVSPVRRARTNVATCGTDLTRNNGFRRYD